MVAPDDKEDRRLQSAALDNARSILVARHRAEGELIRAKEALELKTAELAQSLAIVRATLESTFDGIFVTDAAGRVTDFNEKYLEMWLVPRELMTGGDHWQIAGRAAPLMRDPEAFLARIREIYETAPPESFDVLELADGRSIERFSKVQVVEQRVVGRVWSFRDITERRRAEIAMREETRVLELLNRTGSAIAAELDLHTVLQRVTDAATELSGAKFGAFFYTVKDESGEAFLLYTLSGAPREAFDRFDKPRATPLFGPTFRAEGILRSDDILRDPRYGQWGPHRGMPKGHLPVRSYLAVPVLSRSGEAFGGLFFGHPDCGVFTERTEQLIAGVAAQASIAIDNARLYQEAQSEIASRELAEGALREHDRRKDEFLATLAHELRNPLAPIRQAALISTAVGATDAQKRWSHSVITRQVQHMSLLLDDLLDISRITRGTLALRREPTELATIVEAAVETARPAIEAKQHVLAIELPREPVRFSADPLRLAQVLSNLLTNAAKYTDPGGRIRLVSTCTEEEVSIRVSDTGIGIAADTLPNIFRMFSQVRSSQDRSEGGLGIGLALSKGLVELHDGRIEAHSAGLGQGSEFIVRLPRTPVAEGSQRAAGPIARQAGSGRKVLVADDNRDAAESLAMLLRMEGHDVRVAMDGASAVEAALAFEPEFAMLDIGMPGMSGYEVAQHLRRAPHGKCMTLVAVTGWGQDSDRARAISAGFDHHFTKPVDPQRLFELLGPVAD